MANFENAKVGYSVYSLKYGNGEIVDIKDLKESSYPIVVSFVTNHLIAYNFYGKLFNGDITADLYHSKPEIVEAKRMVTKTREVWINIYPNTIVGYKSEALANLNHCNSRIDLIKQIITYQEEE